MEPKMLANENWIDLTTFLFHMECKNIYRGEVDHFGKEHGEGIGIDQEGTIFQGVWKEG